MLFQMVMSALEELQRGCASGDLGSGSVETVTRDGLSDEVTFEP